MPCRFLNLLSHIIVTVQVKDVSDEIKSVLVILNIRVEPSKVKAVCEIVFVDLAEIFIAPRGDELVEDLSVSVQQLCFKSKIIEQRHGVWKNMKDNHYNAAKSNEDLRPQPTKDPQTWNFARRNILAA